MIVTTAADTIPATSVWLGRARFALATIAVWLGLHFIGGRFLPPGLDRPPVLAGSPSGILAGLVIVVLILLGAALAGAVAGAADRRRPLMAIGLALALWAFEGGARGGTMDSWLILQNEVPGPPTGAPYWSLLGDYLLLAVAILGAYGIVRWWSRRTSPGTAPSAVGTPPSAGTDAVSGLSALLIVAVVAGVAMFFLIPAVGQTYRGQVYFAAALGFAGGAYAVRRVLHVRDPLWFCLAPLVVGIVGLVVAGLNPALRLPLEYRHLNVIPAWGLARALPVEMVGVGLLAGLWMLRPPSAEDEEPHA